MRVTVARGSSDDQQQNRLVKLYGQPQLFKAAATGTDQDKLAYLKTLWINVNRQLCGGRLKRAKLDLSKHRTAGEIGYSGYVLGSWVPSTRTLSVSRRLFTIGQEGFALQTIVHELCHQAVTDVDGEAGDISHGGPWQAWMKKAGLKPQAVFSPDDLVKRLMKPREQQTINNRVVKMDGATQLSRKEMKVGAYCRFLNERNAWVPCMIAGFTKRGTERAAVFNLLSPHWVAITLDNLWRPTGPMKNEAQWSAKLARYSDYLQRTLPDFRSKPDANV